MGTKRDVKMNTKWCKIRTFPSSTGTGEWDAVEENSYNGTIRAHTTPKGREERERSESTLELRQRDKSYTYHNSRGLIDNSSQDLITINSPMWDL